MYKKIPIDDGDIRFDYLKEPINFNKMPVPFNEISADDYFQKLNSWHFEYYSYMQLFGNDASVIFEHSPMVEVMCDFNGNEGVARAFLPKSPEQMKFFKLGCDHDYEILSSDSLTYTYQCKKCGNVITMPNGR